MLKIRKYIFETNSSSSDYYADDLDDDEPRYRRGVGSQCINIVLEYAEDVTDERIKEIGEILEENQEKFLDLIEDICGDGKSGHFYGLYYEYFELSIPVALSIAYAGHGKYDIIDYEGMPLKNDTSYDKNSDKEKFMKLFAELGITDIIGVEDIYGDEVEEIDEFID